MLSGNYTVPQILDIANNQWVLRNKRGKKVARSTFYRILAEPFFYGSFEYPRGSGNWYEGKHAPMITADEYDHIQILLGRKGRPRPKKHIFAYTGMIRCAECGAAVTAENKIKIQKNGNIHRYIYYHCTKRINPSCSQRSITVVELERQVKEILERIEIPEDFVKWAMDALREENEKESLGRQQIFRNQRRDYDSCVAKIDGLIDMRAAAEISQDQFAKKQKQLLDEKRRLQSLIKEADNRINEWVKRADEMYNFAHCAKSKFENGSMEVKKGILASLGSNLLLRDKKLEITVLKPLRVVEEMAIEVSHINKRLEPLKIGSNNKTPVELYDESLILLRGWDSNPQPSG